MKTSLVLLSAVLGTVSSLSFAQMHSLEKRWESAATLKIPESVRLDPARRVLYVTNIDGEPWARDGKGSVGRVGLDGTVLVVDWVTGLEAPKGMGLRGDRLYVADLDNVVVIDVEKGAIVQRIAVPGAEGLNDVTIDPQGVVYVSDSKAKRVYRIEDGRAGLHLDQLKGPNGVLWHAGALYVLDKGALFRVGADKTLVQLVDGLAGRVDGVEPAGGGDFLVTSWEGVIYYVKADGTKETLQDTRARKLFSADIAYDATTRTLYVPTFWSNSVAAYQVK